MGIYMNFDGKVIKCPKPLVYDQNDYGFFNGSLGDYGVITIMEKDYKKLIKNQIENRLPKQVQFNDKKKATTLIFKENVIVVKARDEDKYDRRIGFLEAYFQATSGMSKTKALKYLNEIVKDKAVKQKSVKGENK